jgi:hypothetical protein
MMPKKREDRVQWIQLGRESNEIMLSEEDEYNEPTTMISIMTYPYKEDSVTIEPLRLISINKHLDRSQKYERVAMGIKPPINRAFIQDTFHHLTITNDYDNLPSDTSISQHQSVTNKENVDNIHENTDNDDHDQEVNPTVDEDITKMIAVWKNSKPEVETIKREVEEYCMMKDLEENEENDDQLPGRPLREIQRALAHYNEVFAAALTTNGIKFAANTIATDTLATSDEEFVANDTLDEELVTITALTNYEEGSTNVTLVYYEYDKEIPTTIFAEHDEECAAALADNDEEYATTHAKYDSTHQQDDAQHQLMLGQSIPRASFMDKAFPNTVEEAKRGLEFLDISDNMPRHSGTIAVARRAPMPGNPRCK